MSYGRLIAAFLMPDTNCTQYEAFRAVLWNPEKEGKGRKKEGFRQLPTRFSRAFPRHSSTEEARQPRDRPVEVTYAPVRPKEVPQAPP